MAVLSVLAAMRAYWQNIAPKVRENIDLGGEDAYPTSAQLDDISIAGQQTEDNGRYYPHPT